MVLLGDIVGEDDAMVAAATSQVVRLANARSGEGFIAVNAEARRKFWLDRARTAAIAKHTNAFKINEDVVIPLERLGEYTDAIERINIELSIRNKLELLDALDEYFSGEIKPGKTADVDLGRRAEARELLARARGALAVPARRHGYAGAHGAREFRGARASHRRRTARARVFDRLQDRSIRVSWKTEVQRRPRAHFRRRRLHPGAGRVRRRAQARAAGPGVRRPAHARRRRQRAHQHPGELRQLRHAAYREPRGGAHHGHRAQVSTA